MSSNEEIHRLVNAIALKNASEHSGSTNVNTVLSRILSLKPELKKEITHSHDPSTAGLIMAYKKMREH